MTQAGLAERPLPQQTAARSSPGCLTTGHLGAVLHGRKHHVHTRKVRGCFEDTAGGLAWPLSPSPASRTDKRPRCNKAAQSSIQRRRSLGPGRAGFATSAPQLSSLLAASPRAMNARSVPSLLRLTWTQEQRTRHTCPKTHSRWLSSESHVKLPYAPGQKSHSWDTRLFQEPSKGTEKSKVSLVKPATRTKGAGQDRLCV